jgi:hypothetical protein
MTKLVKENPTLKFIYSYPYESSLLRIAGKKLTQKHSDLCLEKAADAQKVWNKNEKKVLSLFKEMYKIDINEKFIKAYVSLVALNSYSDPMTIAAKEYDFKSDKSKRIFTYVVIHELAHYFSYTRRDKFFNYLLSKVKELNLLDERGANLHYLIQAVEFGIGGELFGKENASLRRNWIVERNKDNEYGKSAKLLKEQNVPLDKTCLEFISKTINTS